MNPTRVLVLALSTQALLAVAAVGAAHALNTPLRWGVPARDVPIGLGAAIVLALANYGLLVAAPRGWLVDNVRGVYRRLLVPLFMRLNRPAILALAVAAGLGEELFFRGVVQHALGWIAASVVFGLAHVGGRQMLGFGIWAVMMGLALGALAMMTGGLTAPAVAHGVYDALALEYIRRTSASVAGGFHREQQQ